MRDILHEQGQIYSKDQYNLTILESSLCIQYNNVYKAGMFPDGAIDD